MKQWKYLANYDTKYTINLKHRINKNYFFFLTNHYHVDNPLKVENYKLWYPRPVFFTKSITYLLIKEKKVKIKITWHFIPIFSESTEWNPVDLIFTNAAEDFFRAWVFRPIWHNFSKPRPQRRLDPIQAIVQTVLNRRSPSTLLYYSPRHL